MADTQLTDEHGNRYSYDNIATLQWLRGHVPGVEAAANWIKERAVKLFQEGKYAEAQRLREMAIELTMALVPDMEKRAKQQEHDYPESMLVASKPKKERSR